MISGRRPEVSISIENSLEIANEEAIDSASKQAFILDRPRIKQLVSLILDNENVKWAHIGVVFSTHDFVRDLNRTYLGHDFETDVLSFVIDETDRGLEGEVYIDVETALERHVEFNSTFKSEIERYVAHGVLHLAGYRDASEEDKSKMHSLEDFYVAQL